MNFKLKSINTNLLNVKKFKNIVTKEIDYIKANNSDEMYTKTLSPKAKKLKGGPTEGLLDPNDESMVINRENNLKNEKIDEDKLVKISIPESMGYGGYTATYYSNNDNSWDWNPDTNQGKLYYNYWVPNGEQFDNGIAVYDDRYLIACTTTFGNIGDKVDFYLSDGTKIPCIIADIKSQEVVAWDNNPANAWGHNNGQNIIEFEVSKDAFMEYGDNPGTNGWYENWGGKKVVGAINLGENIIKYHNMKGVYV